jgi:hypothetical protein
MLSLAHACGGSIASAKLVTGHPVIPRSCLPVDLSIPCRGPEPHETSLCSGCPGAVSHAFESSSAEDSSSSTMGASSTQCKKLNRLTSQALAKAGNIGNSSILTFYCQPSNKCLALTCPWTRLPPTERFRWIDNRDYREIAARSRTCHGPQRSINGSSSTILSGCAQQRHPLVAWDGFGRALIWPRPI